LERTNLSNAHLGGADLLGTHLERADLRRAHLERADLTDAYLEGSDLEDAYFNGACLVKVHLEGVNLLNTRLEGVQLFGAQFSTDTKLEGVNWGNYILGDENLGNFFEAEKTYRYLKQWYTNAGIYDIAGEFFFREMTAQRKRIKWWPYPTQRKRINWWMHPRHRAWSKFVSLICGYGERPHRVVLWAMSWIVGLALLYLAIGSVWEWSTFRDSLYFSMVSFTALGYGGWVDETNGWIKGIGAFESFIGVFTIALFLITFTRKMRRRKLEGASPLHQPPPYFEGEGD